MADGCALAAELAKATVRVFKGNEEVADDEDHYNECMHIKY